MKENDLVQENGSMPEMKTAQANEPVRESGPGTGGKNCITLWTAQAQVVMDTLRRDGIYMVKRAYVDQKYRETAWSFRTAYWEFGRIMEKKVLRPQGAESPIWLYADPRWTYASPGSWLMKLEIPEESVVLFDRGDWNDVLNLSLVGSEKEKADFAEELHRQGVPSPEVVFEKPFYPLLKRKVIGSWSRLLERQEIPADRVQAASWILKEEWIRECRHV